jgi:hypothetical protein
MTPSKIASLTFALLCLSSANLVNAAGCELAITRTACAGQEAISYKKCDGEASCTEAVEAADAAACQAEAVKACENKRLNITKSKVIGASFNGAALKNSAGGDDFCVNFAGRAAQFDKCGG